jgi:PDZ domain-containing protein
VNTGDQSVAPGTEADPEAPPAARSRRWLWAIPPLLLVLAIVGASIIRIPYYSLAPGSAVSLNELVSVEDAESYPPAGELFLTTVSLRRATVLDAVRGWIDSSISIRPEEEIVPPDVSRRQLREFNLELMADSKQTAVAVALERLGYDVRSGSGVEIIAVVEDAPATGNLAVGDTIVAVGGRPVTLSDEAVALLGERRPGDTVRLEVRPADGGEARQVEVTLGSHPEDAGRPFLGVQLQTRDFELDFPFDVTIDSRRIGGPSAGLAFTLTVIDHLTPGELTGGRRVAVTGSIAFDGSVGAVGGVAQKTVAVRRAGAELFLVPRSEYDEAREHAGGDLRIAAVDDVDDALRALADVGGNGLALPSLADAAERA